MVLGVPCICIKQTSARNETAISTAPSARSALTSLMILAPASKAFCITSGFDVSIEIGTLILPLKASITGITRFNSFSTLTSGAPGRVDSPPISIIPAPSSTIIFACAIALEDSINKPPSEKESGVTFSTPMMIG